MRNTTHFFAAGALTLALASPVWAACTYTVTNNWGSGFTGEIKVTNNTSQSVNGWSVSWQESNASITNAWNATLSGSNPYSATGLSWNSTLAPGASASFGFQGNGTAGAPVVSGSLCGGTSVSSSSKSSSISSSSRSSSLSRSSSSRSSSSSSSKSSSSSANEGSWMFEENAVGFCNSSDIVKSGQTGYTGVGYADTADGVNATIVWSINTASQKTYAIQFRYANGAGTRSAKVLVNNVQTQTLNFSGTGAWNAWQTITANVPLNFGVNSFKIVADTSSGLPNVDYILVSGDGVTPAACSTTSSSASSSSRSSSSASSNNGACPTGLEGWASVNADNVNGTTGGGNATPTTVTTFSDLKAAVQDKSPRVIIVSGTIKTEGGSALAIGSNKTIQGANKYATIYGGITMNGVSNVIIRNLNIQGVWPNAGPDDTVASHNSHHIWYDHLNIWDSGDGSLDITNESNYQTVSWTKFWYSNKSHTHRFASLNGSGGGDHPEDFGKLKVTYHHNWWSTNVDQRMPRVVYGTGHQYNNFFNSAGNSYCIGVGSYGVSLIENNYFKDVNNPHQFSYDVYTHITARGNIYDNTTGNKQSGMGGVRKVSGQDFDVVPFTTPPYKYALDSADKIPDLVTRCAGPQ
jgi:pectate lyase